MRNSGEGASALLLSPPKPSPDRPDGVRSGESCVDAKSNRRGVNVVFIIVAELPPGFRTGVRMFSASGSGLVPWLTACGWMSSSGVTWKTAVGGGSRWDL